MADADLLTTSEAGVILNKSGRTVQRLVNAGLIPVAHTLPGDNGAKLLRRSDVLAYAAERARAKAEQAS